MRIRIGLLCLLLACVVQAGYAAEIPVDSYSWLPGYAPWGHYAAAAYGPRVDPEVDPTANAWTADFISAGVIGELTDGVYPGVFANDGHVGFGIADGDGARLFFDLGSVQALGACVVNHSPPAGQYGDGFRDVTFRFSSMADPNVSVVDPLEWSAPLVISTAYPDVTGDQYEVLALFGNSARWVYVAFEGSSADLGFGYLYTWNALGEVDFYGDDYLAFSDQPDSVAALQGDTVEFSVATVGNPTISYQWKKNGVDLSDAGNISGATTDTLTITNVQVADADPNYSCVATNAENPGGVESNMAALTVVPVPALSDYGVRVMATDPVAYYSFDEGSGNLAAEQVSRNLAKFMACTTPVHTANAPFGSAVDTSAGNATDHPTRTDGVWIGGGDQIVGPFAVEFMMKWNGSDLTGNILRSPLDNATVTFENLWSDASKIALKMYTQPNYDNILLPAELEDPNFLTWHHIVIMRETGASEVYVDGVLNTSWYYRNAGPPAEDPPVMNYTGLMVGGWAHPTYGRAFRGELDEIAYYDLTGEADNTAAAVVIASHAINTGPAYVVKAPSNAFSAPGGSAEFRCVAAGAATITYQWKKDGVDLVDGAGVAGATTPILTLSNIPFGDTGSVFTCAVANGEGGETSAGATLTVDCYWVIPADFDGDCDVDMVDLAIFAQTWMADSTVPQ